MRNKPGQNDGRKICGVSAWTVVVLCATLYLGYSVGYFHGSGAGPVRGYPTGPHGHEEDSKGGAKAEACPVTRHQMLRFLSEKLERAEIAYAITYVDSQRDPSPSHRTRTVLSQYHRRNVLNTLKASAKWMM